ncbi:L-alanine-DL-glutamate epimerase-like enolase superfamily enzyme [Friedmanniella endophytica]|uniref:L-alanine-DL-glutamate epimerase-like enolase superfamily enzyme n=1 Tax=Microlunatus kandeliicorticis TaxID=1759536 RepID=A0A7W3P7I9_9ACTN|nr:enolase C-terminal domain-like protein [Microlunatus kandeliicorticis]MBA8796035.1 L-alanine-DL-glutamate epimerase-like enolase superfamily enzyme [Microlunatus kandeliicorticis]
MSDELGRRRIGRVETGSLTGRYPRLIGKNARLGDHGRGPVSTTVTVETTDGLRGWGLAGAVPGPVERFVGRTVGELFDPVTGVVDPDARALDLALHDLAGRALDLPVHRLLGTAGPQTTPVYDGGIYFSDLDARDRPAAGVVLADVAEDATDGFAAFKLKIGRGHRWTDPADGLARDVAVTRAVRDAHPDAVLLVDANDGYDLATTLRYLDATADCGLFWLEEPFVENRSDLEVLRRWRDENGSSLLVADGETCPDVEAVVALAADGLVDVLLMDVIGFGFTAWRSLVPRLAGLGVASSPHAWGELPKTLYAAQLARGLGTVVQLEAVPGRVDGLDTSAYRFDGRSLGAPDLPGFGLPEPGSGPGTRWRDLL